MTTAPAPHDQPQRLPAGWHVNDELMPASEAIIRSARAPSGNALTAA
jgi:hypothetical protein